MKNEGHQKKKAAVFIPGESIEFIHIMKAENERNEGPRDLKIKILETDFFSKQDIYYICIAFNEKRKYGDLKPAYFKGLTSNIILHTSYIIHHPVP